MTSTLHDLMTSTDGLPCRTVDPEIFFSKSSSDRAAAIALCQRCPIRQACAQYALDHPSMRGVWGGTTVADRRTFRTGEPCRFDEQGRMRLVCGSEKAYRSHFSYREQPCDACVAAHEALVEADRRARLAVEHAAGGSSKGFWIHRSLSDAPCAACREALAVRNSQNRQARARRGLVQPRAASVASGGTGGVNGAPGGVQAFAIAS